MPCPDRKLDALIEDGPNGPVRFIPEHVYYPPVNLDAGFYLFVAASVVAVIASVVIVLTVKRKPLSQRRASVPP